MIALKIKNQLGCPDSTQICRQIANLEVQHKIYNSINAVSSAWNNIGDTQPVFLQKAYLSSLEKVNSNQHEFRYVEFVRNDKTVAVAYFQLITLRENIGLEDRDSWAKKRMKQAINSIKFNLLICGNAFITGDFGFHYNSDLISGEDAFLALNQVVEQIKKDTPKINVVLVKDFKNGKAAKANNLLNFGFVETHFQPNMQVFIRENWQSIEDYKADIVSKYKKRHRSVVNKANDIQSVVLTPELLKKHETEIIDYYKEIIGRSEFNLGEVAPNYFHECVCNLPENFIVKGYFHEGHLAGFISYIFNNSEMESHFIGYDSKYNHSHKIYNYILYDLLETAIDNKMKVLTYGRTAMEIKSTVGAVGTEMNAFLWIKNPILRPFLKPILARLGTEEWQARNPFK